MNWFNKLFNKFSLSALEKSCKGILDMLKPFIAPALKKSIDELWDHTKQSVEFAEATGKSGDEKFELVYNNLYDALGAIGKVFLSVAIELAVSFIRTKAKLNR